MIVNQFDVWLCKWDKPQVDRREETVLVLQGTCHFPALKMSTQASRACFCLLYVCSKCRFTLRTCDRPATVCKCCGNCCAVRFNGVVVGSAMVCHSLGRHILYRASSPPFYNQCSGLKKLYMQNVVLLISVK